jgi:hypothetical protein
MKRIICLCYLAVFIAAVSYAQSFIVEDLAGIWTASVEYNRSFDIYKIRFTSDGRCTIKISNDNTEQETEGNWSYDGTLFRLNATFRNAKISYLNNIQWSSVLNLAADHNSFNILGKAATNGPQTRFTFFRQDNSVDFNEKVIPQIFNTLSVHIPQHSRLAIVGITSPDQSEGTYYLNELTLQFVNERKYTIVDRSDIDKVLSEQNFQMSGYVDDNAFVSIGKFIGATVVITGSIYGTGTQKRMVIKAIDVLTSEILSMASVLL